MKSMITSSMMVVVTTIVIHSLQISYTDASMTSGITQFWNRITSFTSGTTSSIIAVNSNLDPVVKPVQEESFECPVVEDDIFCEQLWEPVECNKLCNYTNACEAGGAGFLVDTDCVDIVVEEEGGVSGTKFMAREDEEKEDRRIHQD